jgi:hypothetical protein
MHDRLRCEASDIARNAESALGFVRQRRRRANGTGIRPCCAQHRDHDPPMHLSTVIVLAGVSLGAAWLFSRRRDRAQRAAQPTAPSVSRADSASLHALGERLVTLISPAGAERDNALGDLRAAFVASAQAKPSDERASGGGPRIDEGDDLLWTLRELLDWKLLFFVDWKDRESLVQSVNSIAELWGVAIDWGVEDPESDAFLDQFTVDELMPIAHASLATQGFALWNWATDGDCYSGWIARASDDEAIMEISRQVDVAFRTGDQPF